MIIIFACCVAFLYAIGLMFNWTYVDSSVYICEYFAPILGIYVSLLVLIKGVKFYIQNRHKFNWKWILTLIIQILNMLMLKSRITLLLLNLQKNEGLTNKAIFNRVVNDLYQLAAQYSLDYYTVNIIVYIWPFFMICVCWFLQTLINNKQNKNSN